MTEDTKQANKDAVVEKTPQERELSVMRQFAKLLSKLPTPESRNRVIRWADSMISEDLEAKWKANAALFPSNMMGSPQ